MSNIEDDPKDEFGISGDRSEDIVTRTLTERLDYLNGIIAELQPALTDALSEKQRITAALAALRGQTVDSPTYRDQDPGHLVVHAIDLGNTSPIRPRRAPQPTFLAPEGKQLWCLEPRCTQHGPYPDQMAMKTHTNRHHDREPSEREAAGQ